MNKKSTELREKISHLVENILIELGEDVGRNGLKRTPERVEASLK